MLEGSRLQCQIAFIEVVYGSGDKTKISLSKIWPKRLVLCWKVTKYDKISLLQHKAKNFVV
jgi:hypothetical protein